MLARVPGTLEALGDKAPWSRTTLAVDLITRAQLFGLETVREKHGTRGT